MSSMKIYLIQRDEDTPVWDVYNGFVIAASNPKGVRRLAALHAADEGKNVWLDKTRSTVKCVAERSKIPKALVILSDFNAG